MSRAVQLCIPQLSPLPAVTWPVCTVERPVGLDVAPVVGGGVTSCTDVKTS